MELMFHGDKNEVVTPLNLAEAIINFSLSHYHGANIEFIRQLSEHLTVYWSSYERLDARRLKDEQ